MQDLEQVRAIFDEAIELQGEHRAAFLDRATAGAAELRSRVESLLAAAEKQDEFLATPTVAPDVEATSARRLEQRGVLIDRYQLLELIGEGGFGSVWLAEQQRPVVRRVALKVIKLGMDTRQVIARFEAERQALALMDHPNIARVFDAGTTEAGRPYFVMELVSGEPITAYCDAHNLTIRQRLGLFAQVCEAVQHAHTKGVIHRDLKPSNVLVSTNDGRPLAKIIDFGIAKATAARLSEKVAFTEHRQFIGTPEYISPEQAQSSPDVDTRSDIYSLGVLLYELLVGVSPFDPGTLRSAAYSEIQRIIREIDPPRPSTRLGSSGELANIAARRRLEPSRLRKLIRGELDWIVMKALEKDRRRRYDTASALALDVQRHLAGEPVLAVPPSAAYRVRKFVTRHKAPVTAAALVAGALVLGIIGTSVGLASANEQRQRAQKASTDEAQQRRRAEKNEERAMQEARRAQEAAQRAATAEAEATRRAQELERVSEFQAKMLRDIAPADAGVQLIADLRDRFSASLEREPAAEEQRAQRVAAFESELRRVNATDAAAAMIDRTILKPALAAIDSEFQDQPLVSASLRHTLGEIYGALGRFEEALSLTMQALETCRAEVGSDHPYTLECLNSVVIVLLEQDNPAEAEPYLREMLQTSLRVLGPQHRKTIDARNKLGVLLRAQGRLPEAEQCFRETHEVAQAALGEDDLATINTLVNLASVLRERGRFDEAQRLLHDALDHYRRVLGPDHPTTITTMNNLAVLFSELKRPAEAEPLYRQALESNRRLRGEDHPSTLQSQNNLASALLGLGRHSEAEPLIADTLDRCRRLMGSDHSMTLLAVNNMGALLKDLGRLAEAEPYYREALENRRRSVGDEHPLAIVALNNLAGLIQDQRRYAEAEPLRAEALEKARRLMGENHPLTLSTLNGMATLLFARGRFAEAEPLLREALERSTRVRGPDHPDTLRIIDNLSATLGEQGKLEEAERHSRQALEKRRKLLGEDHRDTIHSMVGLALVLRELGRSADAEPYARQSAQKAVRILGPDHPRALYARYHFVSLLRELAKFEEARRECGELLSDQQRTLGKEHPETLRSLTCLGKLLGDLGEPAEAEERLRNAVTVLERVMGEAHPWTASARAGLGDALASLGRYEEAEQALLTAHETFSNAPQVGKSERRQCIEALVRLYERWHAAAPEAGHDHKAAQWSKAL